jgi:8-oxo-dGTP pyrophosphatase MutT (NUDIX family)
MKNIVLCIVVNNEGEILLQKKTNDYRYFPGAWSLFGGKAESKNLDEEMKRELIEEIGIELKTNFLFNFNLKVEESVDNFHVFFSKVNDLSKISIGEGAGIAFFAENELSKIEINPVCIQAINLFLERKNGEEL